MQEKLQQQLQTTETKHLQEKIKELQTALESAQGKWKLQERAVWWDLFYEKLIKEEAQEEDKKEAIKKEQKDKKEKAFQKILQDL